MAQYVEFTVSLPIEVFQTADHREDPRWDDLYEAVVGVFGVYPDAWSVLRDVEDEVA